MTLKTNRMKVEVTKATGALRFLNASGNVLIAQNPDPGCFSVASQYMFGSAIMVSPITSYNATSRSVYLPSGTTWYDFWTGAASAGSKTITAAAGCCRRP